MLRLNLSIVENYFLSILYSKFNVGILKAVLIFSLFSVQVQL